MLRGGWRGGGEGGKCADTRLRLTLIILLLFCVAILNISANFETSKISNFVEKAYCSTILCFSLNKFMLYLDYL